MLLCSVFLDKFDSSRYQEGINMRKGGIEGRRLGSIYARALNYTNSTPWVTTWF
jgi:hypothetical protein